MSGLGVLGGGSQPSGDSNAKSIDATSDGGIMEMQSRGLPVKIMPVE
jgi:hypothetical protein